MEAAKAARSAEVEEVPEETNSDYLWLDCLTTFLQWFGGWEASNSLWKVYFRWDTSAQHLDCLDSQQELEVTGQLFPFGEDRRFKFLYQANKHTLTRERGQIQAHMNADVHAVAFPVFHVLTWGQEHKRWIDPQLKHAYDSFSSDL